MWMYSMMFISLKIKQHREELDSLIEGCTQELPGGEYSIQHTMY